MKMSFHATTTNAKLFRIPELRTTIMMLISVLSISTIRIKTATTTAYVLRSSSKIAMHNKPQRQIPANTIASSAGTLIHGSTNAEKCNRRQLNTGGDNARSLSQLTAHESSQQQHPTDTASSTYHLFLRDADDMEQLLGGERYSLVPMPHAMKSTTIYVGNLCEFVHDKDLSNFFSQISSLKYVPSCVVRKTNTQSLCYGFVSFPTEHEKEIAIEKFHNTIWNGKRLKVEAIREDDSNCQNGIVRIPEYMVDYVYGKQRTTAVSTSPSHAKTSIKSSVPKSSQSHLLKRISRDDVERLSRGQPSKRRGYGSRNVPHRLNDDERKEFDRAITKGYLSLVGNGNRRTRKGSPLTNIHRQYCDSKNCPQIILFKSILTQDVIDEIFIDLSPLRIHGLYDTANTIDEYLIQYRTQILTEADATGMKLNLRASPKHSLSLDDENDCMDEITLSSINTETISSIDQNTWATNPIWQLPVVSLGIFIGERSNAKTMASNLAKLWHIPEVITINDPYASSSDSNRHGPQSRRDAGARSGGHTKMKGISEYRKRGGGHRQAW